jgi:hypothetical protein
MYIVSNRKRDFIFESKRPGNDDKTCAFITQHRKKTMAADKTSNCVSLLSTHALAFYRL